jgi:hypothetical protein
LHKPTPRKTAETKKNPEQDKALPGFEKSPYFNESTYNYHYPEGAPDALRIHVNAPGNFDRAKPTRVIYFTLPAGNTIEQTIGAKKQDGLDWHYNIQQIGAQTRALRESSPGENIVIAYIEAPKLNANAWRKNDPNRGLAIAALFEDVKTKLGTPNATIDISGHSAGRALKFAYIDSMEAIPDNVKRFSFLDSDHSYNASRGKKLADWVQKDDHFLTVIAYDDQNITYQGKPVAGAVGYLRTLEMISDFKKWGIALTEEKKNGYTKYSGLNGRVNFIIMNNPDNKILHTETVYRNGFIYSQTAGTPLEGVTGDFNEKLAFEKFIQYTPEKIST